MITYRVEYGAPGYWQTLQEYDGQGEWVAAHEYHRVEAAREVMRQYAERARRDGIPYSYRVVAMCAIEVDSM